MSPTEEVGRLQLTAGLNLLAWSRLVRWNNANVEFLPNDLTVFTEWWRTKVHATFGRLIAWLGFSAGAEYLAKGSCLLHGLEDAIRQNTRVMSYPTGSIDEWAARASTWNAPMVNQPTYGTLGSLVFEDKKTQSPSPLRQLCQRAGLDAPDCNLLIGGYKLLSSAIRNRDAHTYVPNIRDSHYNLVAELFTPCFNLLIRTLPKGKAQLQEYLIGSGDLGKSFID